MAYTFSSAAIKERIELVRKLCRKAEAIQSMSQASLNAREWLESVDGWWDSAFALQFDSTADAARTHGLALVKFLRRAGTDAEWPFDGTPEHRSPVGYGLALLVGAAVVGFLWLRSSGGRR